jgi:hypothetical protein
MLETAPHGAAVPSAHGGNVLVIQSGQPAFAVETVEASRMRFPGARLSVLIRRDALAALPGWDDVEVIQNEGPRPHFVQALRRRRFDRVVFLVSGQPGFWKLQALASVLNAREVYAVDETHQWIRLSLRHPRAALRHLARRFDPGTGRTFETATGLAREVLGAVSIPLTFAGLVFYERVVSAAARRRGARNWKQENRPEATGRSA